MQHIAHRASDARAHPALSRDVLNHLGARVRQELAHVIALPMPDNIAAALRKVDYVFGPHEPGL